MAPGLLWWSVGLSNEKMAALLQFSLKLEDIRLSNLHAMSGFRLEVVGHTLVFRELLLVTSEI